MYNIKRNKALIQQTFVFSFYYIAFVTAFFSGLQTCLYCVEHIWLSDIYSMGIRTPPLNSEHWRTKKINALRMEGFQWAQIFWQKISNIAQVFGINLIVFVTSKAHQCTFLHRTCIFRSGISQKHFQRACFDISVDKLEAVISHAAIVFNSPSVYPVVLLWSLTSQVFQLLFHMLPQLILLVSFTCIQGNVQSSSPHIVGTGKDSSGFCLLLSDSVWAPTE